jgi:RarD protein
MILARILLLCTVIIWGWTFVATKVALKYMSPVEVLGWRLILGLPVLLAVIGAKRLRFGFCGGDRKFVLAASAVITVHFLLQVTGLKYTSATNTGWIISITPLVMVAMSFVFLRERIGRWQMVGIAVATLGILLLISKGKLSSIGRFESVGDWLILATAHTWALYTVLTRDVSRRCHPLTVTFGVLFPSAVVVVGLMLFTSDWSKFAHLPAEAVLALLFLGVLGMALAHWFWQEGVSKLGSARAGVFLYIEPLATTALAVPYLGESYGIVTAVGGLLVLGGVIVAERLGYRPQGR